MFERILVPVDGSAESEQALPAALAIARRTRAELYLVHVFAPAVVGAGGTLPAVTSPYWNEELRADAEQHLQSLVARAAITSGARARADVIEGPVVDTLLDYASELDIDLIVMASHGRGGISRAWLGSVTDGVVRRSGIPVLVTPADASSRSEPEATFGSIVIPLDGSATSECVLPTAAALAHVLAVPCTLLRIVTAPYLPRHALGRASVSDVEYVERQRAAATSYLEHVAGALRADGLLVRTLVVAHDQAAAGILNSAVAADAGMIAMATHGYGGWRRLTYGSVADKVLRGTSLPVLLVRGTETARPLSVAADRSGVPVRIPMTSSPVRAGADPVG